MIQNQMYQNPYLQPHNGITWVQGIEGAKAFQMSPNSNVILMDSENDGIFYIKVSDNIGMCNLRIFKYEEVQSNTTPNNNYVTKEEVAVMIDELIKERMDEKPTVQTTKPARKLITE